MVMQFISFVSFIHHTMPNKRRGGGGGATSDQDNKEIEWVGG